MITTMHFIQKRKILHTQGNYFVDEYLLFGWCNLMVLLNERRCLFGKKIHEFDFCNKCVNNLSSGLSLKALF